MEDISSIAALPPIE